MISKEEYFEYLSKRSRLGLLYRKRYLYPKLNKYLTGQTLDVGCGIGDFIDFKSDSIGLDINEMNVEFCKNRGLNVVKMEPDVIPFENDSFESLILDNVLEHIESPDPLLNEIHRVLKVKGRVIFGVPGEKGYASDDDHKQFYDSQSLIDKIENFGFKVITVERMPLPLGFLSKALKSFCLYGVFEKC